MHVKKRLQKYNIFKYELIKFLSMPNYVRLQLTIIICSVLVLVLVVVVLVIICAGIEVEQIAKVRSCIHLRMYINFSIGMCMCMYVHICDCIYVGLKNCLAAGFASMTSAFIFSPLLLKALRGENTQRFTYLMKQQASIASPKFAIVYYECIVFIK